MNGVKIVAVLAIVAGVLGLAYGGFSYTKEDTVAKLGPIEVKAEQQKRVNIPLWAGLLAVVAGTGVLLVSASKR